MQLVTKDKEEKGYRSRQMRDREGGEGYEDRQLVTKVIKEAEDMEGG